MNPHCPEEPRFLRYLRFPDSLQLQQSMLLRSVRFLNPQPLFQLPWMRLSNPRSQQETLSLLSQRSTQSERSPRLRLKPRRRFPLRKDIRFVSFPVQREVKVLSQPPEAQPLLCFPALCT